jgi:hypothetical protein
LERLREPDLERLRDLERGILLICLKIL